VAKRRQVREQPEQLVARVVAIDPSYFLFMENLGNDRPADEEAILNLTGKICWISRRHKQHVGREVDISLISSQRWGKASSRSRLFGSVSIKKQGCGVYVYCREGTGVFPRVYRRTSCRCGRWRFSRRNRNLLYNSNAA
jgi:hypothetical protein